MQSLLIKNRQNRTNFTTVWEQRELGKVFTIRNEKNGDRYTRDDVLAVSDTYGCVNQIAFHGRSFAGEDISNYKVVRTGDIVYTKSPLQAKPYGIIKIVGEETGIISPLYVVNETIEGIDPMFMYYLFDTPERTNNYLSPLVRKGAKNTMNISNEEWLSGIVTISPNEEEQRAIGNYFKSLDNLITLHQRKYSFLFIRTFKIVKEAWFFLKTNAWEQRELGEVVEFYSGLTYTPDDVDVNADTLVLRSSNVKDGEIVDADNVYVDSSIAYSDNVKYGDVIVVVRNGSKALIGKHAQIKRNMPHTVIGAFMTGVRYKVPDFINALLSTPHFDKEIEKDLGATINQITTGSFKKMSFKFPQKIEEQQQIGTYFRNLDNLITLHQRKPFQRKNGGKNYVRRC